ncbi:MAG: hypothetical protein PHS54_04115 [Clostridia bacterium]|nr:hypothetical protein [Clostridia bacterium]
MKKDLYFAIIIICFLIFIVSFNISKFIIINTTEYRCYSEDTEDTKQLTYCEEYGFGPNSSQCGEQ